MSCSSFRVAFNAFTSSFFLDLNLILKEEGWRGGGRGGREGGREGREGRGGK